MNLLALVQVVVPSPAEHLVTYATAFAATATLGILKKYTTLIDTKVGAVIKPIQPIIVLALSMLLPQLIHGTPNVPDPMLFAAAPFATLISVASAEVLRRLKIV